MTDKLYETIPAYLTIVTCLRHLQDNLDLISEHTAKIADAALNHEETEGRNTFTALFGTSLSLLSNLCSEANVELRDFREMFPGMSMPQWHELDAKIYNLLKTHTPSDSSSTA